MRCDCCPLCPSDDICPEAEGAYGIEHKDGAIGCKHPRNWIEKRDAEYCESLSDMGIDMGVEMSYTKKEYAMLIMICKHMIGIDQDKPYHRNGRAFYFPYLNYYSAPLCGDNLLDRLPKFLVESHKSDKSVWYNLTDEGLKWLGRQIQTIIHIKEKLL